MCENCFQLVLPSRFTGLILFIIAVFLWSPLADSTPRCTLHIDKEAELPQELESRLPEMGYRVLRSRKLLTFGLDVVTRTHDETSFILAEKRSALQILFGLHSVEQGWLLVSKNFNSIGDILKSSVELKNVSEQLPNCEDAIEILRFHRRERAKIDPIVGKIRQLGNDEKLPGEFQVTWGEALIRAEALAFDRIGQTHQTEQLLDWYQMILNRARRASENAKDLFEYITAVRRVALTAGNLENYCYINNTLQNLMNEKCGNCQAQTTLLLALHMDLNRSGDENWQLGVELFANHIRPVLINIPEKKQIDLVYQIVEDRKHTTMIYHPESYLRWALRSNKEKLTRTEKQWYQEIQPLSRGRGIRSFFPGLNVRQESNLLEPGAQGAQELDIPGSRGVAFDDASEMVPIFDFPMSRYLFPSPDEQNEEAQKLFNAETDNFVFDTTSESPRMNATQLQSELDKMGGIGQWLADVLSSISETFSGDDDTTESPGQTLDVWDDNGQATSIEMSEQQIHQAYRNLGIEPRYETNVPPLTPEQLASVDIQLTGGVSKVNCGHKDLQILSAILGGMVVRRLMTSRESEDFLTICQRQKMSYSESFAYSTRGLWRHIGAIDSSAVYNKSDTHGSPLKLLPLIDFRLSGMAYPEVVTSETIIYLEESTYQRVMARTSYRDKLAEWLQIIFSETLPDIEKQLVQLAQLNPTKNSAQQLEAMGRNPDLQRQLNELLGHVEFLGFRKTAQRQTGIYRLPDLSGDMVSLIVSVSKIHDQLQDSPEIVLSQALGTEANAFNNGLDFVFNSHFFKDVELLADLSGPEAGPLLAKLRDVRFDEWVARIFYHPDFLFTWHYEPVSEQEAAFLNKKAIERVHWNIPEIDLPELDLPEVEQLCEGKKVGELVRVGLFYVHCPEPEDSLDGEAAASDVKSAPDDFTELDYQVPGKFREPVEIPFETLEKILSAVQIQDYDPALLLLKLEMMSSEYMDQSMERGSISGVVLKEISYLLYLLGDHPLPKSATALGACIGNSFDHVCLENHLAEVKKQHEVSKGFAWAESLPAEISREAYLNAAFYRFSSRSKKQVFGFSGAEGLNFSFHLKKQHVRSTPHQKLQNQIDDLKAEVGSMRTQLQGLRTQLQTTRYATPTDRNTVQAEISRLQIQINNKLANLEQLETQLASLWAGTNPFSMTNAENGNSYVQSLSERSLFLHEVFLQTKDWIILLESDHEYISRQYTVEGHSSVESSKVQDYLIDILVPHMKDHLPRDQMQRLATLLHRDPTVILSFAYLSREKLLDTGAEKAIRAAYRWVKRVSPNMREAVKAWFWSQPMSSTKTHGYSKAVNYYPSYREVLLKNSLEGFSSDVFNLSYTVMESLPPSIHLNLNLNFGDDETLLSTTVLPDLAKAFAGNNIKVTCYALQSREGKEDLLECETQTPDSPLYYWIYNVTNGTFFNIR